MNGRHQRSASPLWSRRQLLSGGLALSGGLIFSPEHSVIRRASRVERAGSDLGAIEHVIFLMQENRSFDHYFGSYPGVTGFDDHPSDSYGVFAQPDVANTTRTPVGVQLPFHLDTATGFGECTRDLSHDWLPQHESWNGGLMDSFVSTHTSSAVDGPEFGLLTMGYYTRADLPYHYALADSFTICDHYFCSVMGPTDPNRLMAISGTLDPAGIHGGPVVTTESAAQAVFSVSWATVPELLEDAGVSWKTYTPPGEGFDPSLPERDFGDAILQYFTQYKSKSSALFQKAFLPTFPRDFAHDVATGTLPQVSWIIPPDGYDEHPPAPPAYGAWFINRVLGALVRNTEVWSKTVLFIMYDENDGFFDHVSPPTAPIGTQGEYLSVANLPVSAGGIAGPIGLGFRVPMLVVSPFSRGGHVNSDVLDHTSQIRFLEERFGIRCENISAWRRQTVGDLTGTVNAKTHSLALPRLPSVTDYRRKAMSVDGCTLGDVLETSTNQAMYPLPATQVMPVQA